MRGRHLVVAVAAACLLVPLAARAGSGPTLTVFGAADLAFAFQEIVPLFEAQAGAKVTLVLGSTGNLAKQIEHGAPADAFFAANVAFVDGLASIGAVVPESRTLYARGRIVVATRRASGLGVATLADLRRPAVRRVAIANPDHAPYGQAAKEALEATGLWADLRPKLVYGESIRHTLQFLESGAVDAAIVARSVAASPQIEYVLVDAALHRPLDQAAAVTARSTRPDLARSFIRFVTGPNGRPIMERYGFTVPAAGGS